MLLYMNRLGKSIGKSLGKSQRSLSKNLGKTAGVSSTKMTSILFLLLTIVIALALGGVAFLVTRKPATMPVISEGLATKEYTEDVMDVSGNNMDVSGNNMEGFNLSTVFDTSNNKVSTQKKPTK